jgi:hypothetical protein
VKPVEGSGVSFPRGPPGAKKKGQRYSHANRGTLVGDVLGPSSALSRGCGGSFVKNKVAWILADAPGAISPCMRQSFVDRQYSPSTGMDHSEWEIILELIRMGFIVKQEHVSEGYD